MSTKRKIKMPLAKAFFIAIADFWLLVASAFLTSSTSMSVTSFKNRLMSVLLWSAVNFIIYVTMYFVGGMHRIYWKFSSGYDYLKVAFITLFASIMAFVAHVTLCSLFGSIGAFKLESFNPGVYFVDIIVSVAFLVFLRLFIRSVSRRRAHASAFSADKKNAMVIGCGYTGNYIISSLFLSSNSKYKAACIIDDDVTKLGQKIHDVPIVGTRDSIAENVHKYQISLIVFAIPTCEREEKAKILKICSQTGCEVVTVPSIKQILSGEMQLHQTRHIDINDLLGREPINTEISEKMSYVTGKTILVTGGGGSIGSELCRQIAKYSPKTLIIFDIYENNAYDIANELLRSFPGLCLVTLIGSVRDSSRLDMVLGTYKPDIIYHAAAHKHVPLMEDSPNEAIKNNVLGTYKLACAADAHGVKRFIMISTDKAVNPTNIMGATKRVCEMIVQNFNTHSKCEFVAVRFGNVLGSNGSVIPLFKKQIEAGGPVTVTHPDIIRYFMTIPEAVSLALEAGAMAKGGEIFVLDMGKPVKIVDLARNMITLMGYVPDIDIQIKYTGLRPGEKLYEELLMAEEGLTKTSNEKIYIGKPVEIDEDKLVKTIKALESIMYDDFSDVRSLVAELVPTYQYGRPF